MNNKGISPLIATVLIVGFTVALAAVIFTWGINFTKDTTERTTRQADLAQKCGEISFDVEASCTEGNIDFIRIANRQDITIQAFKFSISNDDVTEVYDINSTEDALKGFGVKKYSGDFSAVTSPNKVEVRGALKFDNEAIFCSEYVREAKINCQ